MFIKLLILLVAGALTANGEDFDCNSPPGNGHLDLDDCCKLPKLFDHKLVRKCEDLFDEYEEFEDDDEDEPTGACAVECVFNETNLMVNGEVDQAAVTTLLLAAVTEEPEWAPLLETAITTCFAAVVKLDEVITEIMNAPTNRTTQVCSPKAGLIGSCIYSNLLKTCPEDKFTNSADCHSMKVYVTHCMLHE